MKISGFSVIRNAEIMGYPVVESIKSILPLVDEYIIGVGQSEDGTRALIESIKSPQIKIVDTYWDPQKQKGGLILSEKTNEALAHCQNDWCVYLQADEVLHEQDLASLRKSIVLASEDLRVEGLLMKYIHFYGSYDVIATSRRWYRHEVRAIKKSSQIQSVGDAQSFRIGDRKPRVLSTNTHVYHYGWVKPPQQMGEKSKRLNWLWHGNKLDRQSEGFQFERQYGLKKFNGRHPAVMRDRVVAQNWHFEYSRAMRDIKLKDFKLFLSDIFEGLTGYRIGEYKSYELILNKAQK
jgi:hypothetical protein